MNYSLFQYDFSDYASQTVSFPHREFKEASRFLAGLREQPDKGWHWYFEALRQPARIVRNILCVITNLEEPCTKIEEGFLYSCLESTDWGVVEQAIDIIDFVFDDKSTRKFDVPDSWPYWLKRKWGIISGEKNAKELLEEI